MPDPIVCPHCHEQLEIPAEYHGRQVRCANCQNVFVATGGDVPVIQPRSRRSADDEQPPWRGDDRPRRPRREEHDDDRPPRKSNVGVIALLLLTALTIGGCCGGINLLAFTIYNPTFTPHVSSEGKFKVEFPTSENPVAGPISGDDAGQGWQVMAKREMAQEQYTVRCYDLKPEWRQLSKADALEKVAEAELMNHRAAGPKGGLGNQQAPTEHGGFTALDVMASSGSPGNQAVTIMRCILAGKRVYVLSVQGQNTHPEFWWVRKFFLSFEITDPNVKPPKKEDEPKKDDETKKKKQD